MTTPSSHFHSFKGEKVSCFCKSSGSANSSSIYVQLKMSPNSPFFLPFGTINEIVTRCLNEPAKYFYYFMRGDNNSFTCLKAFFVEGRVYIQHISHLPSGAASSECPKWRLEAEKTQPNIPPWLKELHLLFSLEKEIKYFTLASLDSAAQALKNSGNNNGQCLFDRRDGSQGVADLNLSLGTLTVTIPSKSKANRKSNGNRLEVKLNPSALITRVQQLQPQEMVPLSSVKKKEKSCGSSTRFVVSYV
ncbi:MAG: hypothetical protein H7A36_00890 [Chlamydiales bacterium]|nr:hypothetical protein [Chlamydiales bacterium]